MVLQVILRQKTTFSVKIFYLNRTEDIAHTIARAGDNTHVARSQSSQSRKLNFLTLPDLAFSFINKRSGYEIRIRLKNGRKANILHVYICCRSNLISG